MFDNKFDNLITFRFEKFKVFEGHRYGTMCIYINKSIHRNITESIVKKINILFVGGSLNVIITTHS